MTSIRGSLGLLNSGLMGELNPKARRMLQLAATNTDRLVRLINDILNIDRLQSGLMVFDKRPFPVSDFVLGVLDGLRTLGEQSHVSLSWEASPHWAMGDRDRIEQVLTNLVGNAIKFSPAGAEVQVRVKRTDSRSFLFSVQDHGPVSNRTSWN